MTSMTTPVPVSMTSAQVEASPDDCRCLRARSTRTGLWDLTNINNCPLHHLAGEPRSWPDLSKPHPCTCENRAKQPVMVTIKARADEGQPWHLFTGYGASISQAEYDASIHSVEWLGSEVLYEDEAG